MQVDKTENPVAVCMSQKRTFLIKDSTLIKVKWLLFKAHFCLPAICFTEIVIGLILQGKQQKP